MKKVLKLLSLFFLIFAFTNKVNAIRISSEEYESLNVKRSYVVGNYIFDVSKHNPTLKDLMLAAQTAPVGDISIIEIKIARNLGGTITKTYVDILNNEVLDSFPAIDVKYVYESEIKPSTPNQEIKKDLIELFGYEVKFYDGQTEFEKMEVDDGETITPPSNTAKPGYEFNNWYTTNDFSTIFNFANSISTNTNIYGKWIANTYSIQFDDNTEDEVSNMPSTTTKTYGINSDTLNVPTREGYTFAGWDKDKAETTATYTENTINSDLTTDKTSQTLYAIWDKLTYTIGYELNGGSVEVANPTSYQIDTNTFSLTNPTKTGYSFTGWSLGDSEELSTTITITKGSTTGNKNYTAHFEANEYTITFNSNGGSTVTEIIQDYGTTVSAPTAPTKEGHSFAGWYKEAGLSNPYTFTTMPSDDITLYAKWDVNEYTITFNSNDGSAVTEITQDYGTTVSAPTEPTKEGYSFAGWYKEEGLSNPYTFTTMPSDDITLYAKWNVNEYTITFNSNGGSTVTEITQDYGTAVSAPNAPTKTGYDFAKWQLNGVNYTFATMPSNNIELTAIWTPKTYKVVFNSSSMANYNSAICTYGIDCRLDSVIMFEEGYQFEGWDTNASADTIVYEPSIGNTYTYIKNGLPNEDGHFNLYAVFSPIDYTIIYNKNNDNATGIMDNNACTYKNDCVLTNNTFENIGHSFAGWATSADGDVVYTNGQTITSYHSLANDQKQITLYAKWNVKQYTISFNKNTEDTVNNMPSPITQGFGTIVTKPNNPTRLGYEFIDWYTDDATENLYTFTTMPSSSITLYAKWIPIEYTVYLVDEFANAGLPWAYTSYNITHSMSLLPDDKSHDGYTFEGWFANEARTIEATIIPAGSTGTVTWYAKWTPNEYTVTFDYDGGTEGIATTTVTYDSTYGTLPVTTKENYSFVGWTLEDRATIVDANTDVTTVGNHSLYAKWTLSEIEITYDMNTGVGEQMSTKACTYGESCILDSNTYTKENYVFIGWNTNRDALTALYDDRQNIVGIEGGLVTLYAIWAPATYTISFNANTVDSVVGIPENTTKNYNIDYTIPNTPPERVGYTFAGWSNSQITDVNETIYMTGDNYTENANIIFYAKWLQNSYNIRYYYGAGAEDYNLELMPDTDCTYDEFCSLIANNFTKTGYNFQHWNTEPDNSGVSYDDNAINISNLTPTNNGIANLYAIWEANEYNINFDKNAEEEVIVTNMPSTITKTYGTNTDNLSAPTREGYRFIGWNTNRDATTATYESNIIDNDLTTGTTNQTLYAIWEANLVTVDISGYEYVCIKDENDLCQKDENDNDIMVYQEITSSYSDLTGNATYYNEKLDDNELSEYRPDRIGYEFIGWYLYTPAECQAGSWEDGICTGNLIEESWGNEFDFNTPITEENTKLKAKYQLINYTINFDLNYEGAETLENQTINIEDHLVVTNPGRAYSTFIGWALHEDLTSPDDNMRTNPESFTITIDLEDIMQYSTPENTITLYAVWGEINHQVQIHGVGQICNDENHDNICDRDEITNDIIYQTNQFNNEIQTNMPNVYTEFVMTPNTFDINSIEALTERFKNNAGYRFIGWYEVVNQNDNACNGAMPYEKITENDVEYYCVYGDKISTTPIDLSEPITLIKDLNIYAIFESTPQKVTFDLNGGTALTASGEAKTQDVTISSGRDRQLPVLTPDDLTFPSNAEFLGWSVTKNACYEEEIRNGECFFKNEEDEIVIGYIDINSPVTVYAVWNYSKITVNYNLWNPDDENPEETQITMATSTLTKGEAFTPLGGSEINYSTDPVKKLSEYYDENNQTLIYWSSLPYILHNNSSDNFYSLTDSITIPDTEWVLEPTINIYPITRYNKLTVKYYSSIEDFNNENPPLVTNTVNYGETLTLPSEEITPESNYLWTGWETMDILGNHFTGTKNGTIGNFNYNAIIDNTVTFIPTYIPNWYDEDASEYVIDGTTKTFADLLLILPLLNSNPNDITIYVNEDNVTVEGNPIIGSNITMIFSNSLENDDQNDTSATLVINDTITVEGTLKLNKNAQGKIDIESNNDYYESKIIIKNNGKLLVGEEELISNDNTKATIILGENSIINVGTDSLGTAVIELEKGTATINKTNNLGRDVNNYVMHNPDVLILNENTTVYVNVNMLMGGSIEGNGTLDIKDDKTLQIGTEDSPYANIQPTVIIPEEDSPRITEYTITITYYMNNEDSNSIFTISNPLQQGDDYQTTTDVPIRDGYRFVGWSTNPDGPAMYNSGDAIQNIQRPIKLYAIWILE